MKWLKCMVIAALIVGQNSFAQEARVITLSQLEKMFSDDSKAIHVVNFWATWCGPCVKELPYFEKLTAQKLDDTKVTLVSLDLDLNPDAQKVQKFVKARGLRSEVVMLDESDPNAWIDKVDPRWSGALPATIIINHRTGRRIFIDRSLEEGQLEKYLNESNKPTE